MSLLADLPEDLNFVLALHEGSVVGTATGWALAREQPALVLLHTTAGLGNAVGALATARVNRAPLVVLVGQQDRRHLAQETFLAGQLQGLAGDYPVRVESPVRAQDVPGAIGRAVHAAREGRGPALVLVPMNDWSEPAEDLPVPAPAVLRRAVAADPSAVAEVAGLLAVVTVLPDFCDRLARRTPHRSAASEPAPRTPHPEPPAPGQPLRPADVLTALARRLPAEAVVVEEPPSSRPDLHALLPARRPLGFLSAAMGGLGFAMPAAIGVRMGQPRRPVVAVVGDGSSLYQVQSLWTAAHYGVGVVFVLANGRYAIMDRLAEQQGGKPPWPAFEEAGLPEGVLHLLPGGAETRAALVVDPHVRVISFTGSVAAGRKVGAAAAEHLKRAHLELGGNSALIVLPDADLERAASTAAWGSFLHQGQFCMTTGCHLVHQPVADEYVERLAQKAEGLPVGNPAKEQVALGPIIDAGQRDKIHGLVRSSVEGGARLVAGGTYEDLFYRPTVLTGVTDASPAYAEEVFGPVAPVRVFAGLDEAVALATASPYGLSLGILTGDVMRGLDLAERIPTGLVHINDQTVNDEAVAPFGGVAASGTGARFGGGANIEAFTETRWITARTTQAEYPF